MFKVVNYIATTKVENIPSGWQIFMVDGSVPGWIPSDSDYCWNHHRSGGAMTQVDEMPFPNENISFIDSYALVREVNVENSTQSIQKSITQAIVTTQVDADACCAAAWLQLPGKLLKPPNLKSCVASPLERLRAIAYECDHLYVPNELSHLEDFAAQAVATLKQNSLKLLNEMKLSQDRKIWTDEQKLNYYSAAFKIGTQWLIDATVGKCLWPGELGEAAEFWKQVEADTTMLYQSGRISVLNGITVCDMRGIDRPVDVRSFVRAIHKFIFPKTELRPETVIIRDHNCSGHRYTLSSIPSHPKYLQLDYTAGTLERLSEAEKNKADDLEHDYKWGGRQQVAGSPWNNPSVLEPYEVVGLL